MAITLTVMDLQGMFVISKVMEQASSFLPLERLVAESRGAMRYFDIEGTVDFEALIPKMIELNCLMIFDAGKHRAYGLWQVQKEILSVFVGYRIRAERLGEVPIANIQSDLTLLHEKTRAEFEEVACKLASIEKAVQGLNPNRE